MLILISHLSNLGMTRRLGDGDIRCPGLAPALPHPSKEAYIQWHSFTQPGCSLRVVSLRVVGVGVYEGTQRAPVNDQPWNESSKLRRREEINLEHCHRMGTDGAIPDLVNPKFGKFPPDTFPQRHGKFAVLRVILPCARFKFQRCMFQ